MKSIRIASGISRRTHIRLKKKRSIHAIHLRFTIYDLQIMRSGAAGTAKQMRTRIHKAVIGRGGRRGLPMYDVRGTMYDLNYSAPEAREFCEAGAEGCPGVAIGGGYKGAGRRRQAGPAHVRGNNTHDGFKQLRGSCSCTMYDFRCTIAKFARVARENGRRLQGHLAKSIAFAPQG